MKILRNPTTIGEAELLLAELIAAASERGLHSGEGDYFLDDEGNPVSRRNATCCCALGAAKLAGYRIVDGSGIGSDLKPQSHAIAAGNDGIRWRLRRFGRSGKCLDEEPLYDNAESVGHAFREAMAKEQS